MNSLRRGALLILLILLSGVVSSLILSPRSVYAENFSGWAGGCTSGSNCVSGTSDGFMCNYTTCGDPVSGSGDGQFNLPRGVAVDHAGNVYVTDSVNNRVEKFGDVTTQTLITGVDAGSGSVSPVCPSPSGCSENVGSSVTVTATPSSANMNNANLTNANFTGANCQSSTDTGATTSGVITKGSNSCP